MWIDQYNPSPMDMVVADKLVKVFPTPDGSEKRAVDGLSFRVGKGQIYGLLGPNGAGKTTTLRLFSGLMSPTSGSASVGGYDVARNPVVCGFVGGVRPGHFGRK